MALDLYVASPDAAGGTRHYHFPRGLGPIVLGRRGGVDVLLPFEDVEPVHARIECHQGVFCLVDAGSQLGTLLNGARLPPGRRLPLSDGDRIEIAGVDLAVHLAAERHPQGELADLGLRMARELFSRLPAVGAHPSFDTPRGPLVLDGPARVWVLGFSQDGLALDEVDMWREQLSVERRDDEVVATTLSDRPILVNGERLTAPRALVDGDELRLGESVAVFRDPSTAYLERLDRGRPPVALPPPPPDRLSPLVGQLLGLSVAGAALVAAFWLLLP